jgi:hypothetical protein
LLVICICAAFNIKSVIGREYDNVNDFMLKQITALTRILLV